MTKIIQYPNPDISKQEITYLAANVALAGTILTVQNTADYLVNDFIVIEQVGNEYAEMRQIATIPSASSMTVPAVSFAHGILAPIRKTPFNQMRLYRSVDGSVYSMIETKTIDWQDKFNQAIFIDATGNDNYWYKVEYYNSVSTLSIMSSPIKTPTQIGYLTVEDFKRETGISADNDSCAHALRYGAQEIYRKLYTGRQFKTTAQNTQQQIAVEGLEFADQNLDGVIDKNDFVTYEEDQTGVRTYVTSDITSVDVDRHLLTFGTARPTSGKTLVVEFHLTCRKLTELDEKLRRLNMLWAANYIFRNIPIKRLQKGIGGWTINGVSIDFQMGMIQDLIKSNDQAIKDLVADISRVYLRTTQIRRPTQTDQLSWIKSTLRWAP